jgi:hypothetical protein
MGNLAIGRNHKSRAPNRRKTDVELADAGPADAEPLRRRPDAAGSPGQRTFAVLSVAGANALVCWRTAMLWSVNIGSIAGTAIKIHITFLMFLVWIFAAGWASGGPQAALFACVLAHEFGHIFTARAFGVATPDVILLPIGGVARRPGKSQTQPELKVLFGELAKLVGNRT